ncbi:GlsB/YeaQ/YmgE family stress response membrane protein [Denitrificimonas caeni]|uniref:GlsB/YeaQ/YmgE family stress response membrane protein n=1 Tax=Denitrificimonas caeni TaxID=521720 RepID=UPI0019664D1F|nr:GlsB/YeaQ/YmgE family stress response membrane protein [Denitrificimonas caeni]
MGILGTLVIGFFVGILARLLKPGRSGLGLIMTIILGVAGSVVATYGGQALGVYQVGQPAGFIGAVVGAVVLLFIVEALHKR